MAVRNTAILFLSVILLLHPVLPYLEYYTFREYIAENLCVNRDNPESCCEGKCYLEKRINEDNRDNRQEKQDPVVNYQRQVEYNLPVRNNLSFYVSEYLIEFVYIAPLYSSAFCKTIFQPPRVK